MHNDFNGQFLWFFVCSMEIHSKKAKYSPVIEMAELDQPFSSHESPEYVI